MILEELLLVLEQNNVHIRREPLGGGGGGLCKIKDKHILFVDTQANTADMAAICAQAVHQTLDIENIYIKPQVRRFLEKHKPPD